MESKLIIPGFHTGFARNASESAAPRLWHGKVGHWVPGLGVQGQTLFDISGHGNHGTLTNMTNAAWVAGKNGHALDFDGVDDYVNVGNPADGSLDFGTGAFSASVWVKPDVVGFTRELVNKWQRSSNPTNQTWGISINSLDRILFSIMDNIGTNFTAQSNSTVSANVWEFIVATRDSSGNMSLYRNGSKQTSTNNTTTSVSNTEVVKIGSGHTNVDAPKSVFDGLIDDVRVYNRALTQSEITQLYIDPHADLRLRDFVFGHALAAAGGGLPIPVAMKSYRTRRAT